MTEEIITILVGIGTISTIITGTNIYFTRRMATGVEKNVNQLIENLMEFVKKNEQHLSQRIDQLSVSCNDRSDKVERRQQKISEYAEENRERIHNVKDKILETYPTRLEFEQVKSDIKELKVKSCYK